MYAALDSSTLISLAWAGRLDLLDHSPVELIVPEEVYQETVPEGLDRGYADAAAIEGAIARLDRSESAETNTVDDAVLNVGQAHGIVLTNDLALGRRASNLGVRWLRTADLVVLSVRTGQVATEYGSAALRALRSAGRLTEELLYDYLKELQ